MCRSGRLLRVRELLCFFEQTAEQGARTPTDEGQDEAHDVEAAVFAATVAQQVEGLSQNRQNVSSSRPGNEVANHSQAILFSHVATVTTGSTSNGVDGNLHEVHSSFVLKVNE